MARGREKTRDEGRPDKQERRQGGFRGNGGENGGQESRCEVACRQQGGHQAHPHTGPRTCDGAEKEGSQHHRQQAECQEDLHQSRPRCSEEVPRRSSRCEEGRCQEGADCQSAVAKTTPVAKTASKKVAAPKNVKKAVGKVAAKGAVGKTAVAAIASPSSSAPVKRKLTKVAVAVVGKSQPPVIKNKVKVVSYKTEKNTGRPILPKGYVPSAEEEYMSPLQLEYFRQRLMQWRDDLVDESKQTIENLKEEVRDVGDEAERATRETENSLELRTRDRYRKLISKIDSTLKRVDTGDYGFCVDSGEEIGLERMDARLTAERTIDAQERWEHLRKQMGD